jgi:hypothetical protein
MAVPGSHAGSAARAPAPLPALRIKRARLRTLRQGTLESCCLEQEFPGCGARAAVLKLVAAVR